MINTNNRLHYTKQNKAYIKYILPFLLITTIIVSLSLGRYPIPLNTLIKVLPSKLLPTSVTWHETVEIVVFQVRLPRIIAAGLVGAALSVSGAVYQGMFRNPLVSPDILGVSSGAGFGAALGIFLSLNIFGIQLMCFMMGLLAVIITFTLSLRTRSDPMVALVLVGILVGTIFTSATSLLKYLADPYDKLPAITFWLMGSLSSVTMQDVFLILVPMTVGMVPLYLLRWRLNILSLGEEEAKALGLDTKKLRIIVILCSTLMTATSVAISGMIGWVGLIVPHIVRLIIGPNYRDLIPMSILFGSIYLLLVDDIARCLAAVELPLSILTSIIGAPFFLYLLSHKRGGWR